MHLCAHGPCYNGHLHLRALVQCTSLRPWALIKMMSMPLCTGAVHVANQRHRHPLHQGLWTCTAPRPTGTNICCMRATRHRHALYQGPAVGRPMAIHCIGAHGHRCMATDPHDIKPQIPTSPKAHSHRRPLHQRPSAQMYTAPGPMHTDPHCIMGADTPCTGAQGHSPPLYQTEPRPQPGRSLYQGQWASTVPGPTGTDTHCSSAHGQSPPPDQGPCTGQWAYRGALHLNALPAHCQRRQKRGMHILLRMPRGRRRAVGLAHPTADHTVCLSWEPSAILDHLQAPHLARPTPRGP